jgi:hypothetical protein
MSQGTYEGWSDVLQNLLHPKFTRLSLLLTLPSLEASSRDRLDVPKL